ncbi:MAG: hypothetical protein ACRC2K_12840 [Clostridium sp.]
MNERYKFIVSLILKQLSINEISILNENTNKEKLYMILLLLDKYGILLDEDFKSTELLGDVKNMRIKLRKAEEKLLINREFRKKYFEIQGLIENII